jgi:hypothetical protein
MLPSRVNSPVGVGHWQSCRTDHPDECTESRQASWSDPRKSDAQSRCPATDHARL